MLGITKLSLPHSTHSASWCLSMLWGFYMKKPISTETALCMQWVNILQQPFASINTAHPNNYTHHSCFVLFLLWFWTSEWYTYPPGLLHWHWVNVSHEPTKGDNIMTKKSTTKLCHILWYVLYMGNHQHLNCLVYHQMNILQLPFVSQK